MDGHAGNSPRHPPQPRARRLGGRGARPPDTAAGPRGDTRADLHRLRRVDPHARHGGRARPASRVGTARLDRRHLLPRRDG